MGCKPPFTKQTTIICRFDAPFPENLKNEKTEQAGNKTFAYPTASFSNSGGTLRRISIASSTRKTQSSSRSLDSTTGIRL